MKIKGLTIFLSLLAIIFFLSGELHAQQQSVTYPCLGFPQYFGVPAGVTQITAEIAGSDGSSFIELPGEGGRGALLTTTINVTPGDVLTVYSACKTGYGFTRGGRLRSLDEGDFTKLYWWYGSGGGSSAILNQNTVLAVAGGGGSKGVGGFFGLVPGGKGGDAIAATGNGSAGGGLFPGGGGTFGTASTGNGADGTFGNSGLGGGGGGGGGYDPNGGGGGGNGFGGFDGSGGGGGGGGKSYANPSFTGSSTLGLLPGDGYDNGYVRISYNGASNGHRVETIKEFVTTALCDDEAPWKTYTVPNGVRTLLVNAIGGDGGRKAYVSPHFSGHSGAAYGYTARISVVPGEQLQYTIGCKGGYGGSTPNSDEVGGRGGYGFIDGGKGGDGDRPAGLLTYGKGGSGGGGATGIGRSQNTPLLVAPGGGGGGGDGGYDACTGGYGGTGGEADGGTAAPCANPGIGGLLGGGNPIIGGNACSFCTSGGGGGGGGGYPFGSGGTGGGSGISGGGGGGGGRFYAAPGSQNVQSFNPEESRRVKLYETPLFIQLQDHFIDRVTANALIGNPNREVSGSFYGILTITPIYTDFAPPIITPTVTPGAPTGRNGWYSSNVNVSWQVTSDLPVTSQTGCQPTVVSTDTNGFTSSCSATSSAGTTSGSTQTIKRDATAPTITATARDQNGNIYVYGTTTSVPVTVTFTCTDATSGILRCPAAQTFGSNATVTGTAVDNAGNSRTVTFGNIVSDNQPPTISPINTVETPINTNVASVPFTVGDAETPAAQLAVRFNSSNENVISNGLITLSADPNNPASRSLEIIPVSNKVGTTIISIDVIDARGAKTTTTFLVKVKCGTITIQQPPSVNYGSSLNAPLYPSGGVEPYDFVPQTGVLPPNLEFDPEFNRLVGGPVGGFAPTSRQVVYDVTDANGCSNPVTVTVDVACLTNPVVTERNDTAVYSLRGMVEGACPNSTITFDGFLNNQEISTYGAIDILKPLTIQGLGADKLTFKNVSPPGNNNNVFTVSSDATISGLTIKDGFASNAVGGGIRASANLTVRDSLITNNQAARGAGIALTASDKTLTLINTTVSNNTSNSSFDGNGAGILSDGAVNIVNSTVSGNTALGGNNGAAGIYAARGLISNSTIANNLVDNTFGAFNMASGVFGGSNNLTIRSSIIAGNQNNGAFPDVINLFTSNGFNLIGNRGSVTAFNQPTDRTGTNGSILNPLLEALMLNGGTVPTHGFQSTSSPAIDRGFAFGLTTDQRAMMRISDFPGVPNAAGGDGADVGAFEVQAAPTAAQVSVSGRVLIAGGRGLTNATVVLNDGNGSFRSVKTSSFGYFNFDNVPAGQTYVITIVSKRYAFSPRVVSVMDDLEDLTFMAEE